MNREVWITAYGVRSPMGNDEAAFDAALFAGRSAVRADELVLPGIAPTLVPLARCEFDFAAVASPSKLPLDRGTAMALASVRDARAMAGLSDPPANPERLGLFWGSGMGGAATFDATCRTVYAEHRRIRPTTVVTTMPNAPVAELGLLLRAQGMALGYACACASAAVAIGEAMRAVASGRVDVAVAGGSEALLSPGVIASWLAMRVLAPLGASRADAEAMAPSSCRPFAADRAGFALGEGAAAFVLESADHARGRGAACIARLAGYATNCDGLHITQPDAGGQERALRAAFADAGLGPEEIGYVNAHGTATVAGDAAEAASIARVFGAGGVPVSSTKAIHGHLLGAGGAVELLAALRALLCRRLPPQANTERMDPAFAIDLVASGGRDERDLVHAVSNSFAFGGTNAVLVLSRADL